MEAFTRTRRARSRTSIIITTSAKARTRSTAVERDTLLLSAFPPGKWESYAPDTVQAHAPPTLYKEPHCCLIHFVEFSVPSTRLRKSFSLLRVNALSVTFLSSIV